MFKSAPHPVLMTSLVLFEISGTGGTSWLVLHLWQTSKLSEASDSDGQCDPY